MSMYVLKRKELREIFIKSRVIILRNESAGVSIICNACGIKPVCII